MQYHIPIELPDESLYGLIARFVRINGESHLKGCNAFLGNNQHSICDAPILGSFKGLYKSNFYKSDSKSNLDFARLYQQLGGEEGSLNSLLKSSFGEQQYWRFCEQCCAAEIEKYGIAYWHLEHQIPTTLLCLKHQLPLSEIKHKKKITHHHLWLIEESLHHAKHYDDLNFKHWYPIAKIGQQALHDIDPIPSKQIVVGTLVAALKEMGLVDKKGKLKISSFEFAFRTHFYGGFENDLNERLNIKKPRYLLSGIYDVKPDRTLTRLILIYWLFGSWEYFKSCCTWFEVFNQKLIEHKNARSENPTVEMLFKKNRDENRKVCLSYIQSTDWPSRQEFGRLFYKKFSWLLNNDRAWLDRALPIAKIAQQFNLNF